MTDGLSASWSSCQAPLGAQDHIFVTVSRGFINVGHPLLQEDTSHATGVLVV
jgi:hypothetical protein